MRSALGLLPQGLQVRVQRLAAALLLAGRVRLGQQDLRPLLGAGVDARAGLGLLDVLLVLRGGAGGGRRQARGGGRGAAVLGGGGFRKLRKRGGAQRCRLRQREVGRVGPKETLPESCVDVPSAASLSSGREARVPVL